MATENSGVPDALAPGGILLVVSCDTLPRSLWVILIETALLTLRWRTKTQLKASVLLNSGGTRLARTNRQNP